MVTVKKAKWGTEKVKQAIFCACLLVLPLLQFCIFYIGVNFNSILLIFQRFVGNNKFSFLTESGTAVGLSNLKTAFYDLFHTRNWSVGFKNSLLLFFLGLVTHTPLNLIVSYFIYKKARIGGVLKVVLYAPSIMSAMVTIVIYKFFVDEGLPVLLNKWFGTSYGAFTDGSTAFITIFLYGFWSGFGSSILLYTNAMGSISDSIVEAAKLDGISFFGEFIHVTFPMIFPTFKMIMITSVVGIFCNQFTLFEFYGLTSAPPDIITVGYYLFQQTNLMGSDYYPVLSAYGLIMTIVSVPLALLTRKGLNKIDPMEV